MQRKYLLIIALLSLSVGLVCNSTRYGCSRYEDNFFTNLLDIENIDIHRICVDENVSLGLNDGYGVQVYRISEDSFNEFVTKFEKGVDKVDIPKPNATSKSFGKIIYWRKTPTLDSNLFIVPQFRFYQTKCSDSAKFRNMIAEQGNFVAAYTMSDRMDYSLIFLLNGRTRDLYIVQERS